MFRRISPSGPSVALTVDGEPVTAALGDSVAAAMLLAGHLAFRRSAIDGGDQGTPRGAPRGPHCMIGNCFDCLVEIDGVPNRQACLTVVRDGMAVRRQLGRVRITP